MDDDLSVSIGADPSGLRRGMSEAESIIESSAQRIRSSIERIGNLGQQLAGLGATLTASLTVPIVGLVTASIKAYGEMQSLQKGLEAVMGSADKASLELEKLKEVAKLPGLGLEEAVRGSLNLQSIGLSAKNSRNILLQFGNAVATVGRGRAEFERAIYGVQQLANTDFPLGEDLNIIMDALPQVRTLLNDAFGKSRAEDLREMGKSSAEILDVIVKGLSKLPRVTGGINGAFENLRDNIRVNLGKVGEIIDKAFNIEGIVDKINDFTDKVVSYFKRLDPEIQKVILVVAGLVAAIGPLLLGVGGFMALLPVLTAGVTALGTAFLALLSPIGLVTVAIVGVVAAVVANWDKIRPYLVDTLERFKRLYNESAIFRAGVIALGASFEFAFKSIGTILGLVYSNFVDFGKGVLNIFKGIGEGIEGVLTFNVSKIGIGFTRVFSAPLGLVGDLTRNAASSIKELDGLFDSTYNKWKKFDVNKLTIPVFNAPQTPKDDNKSLVGGLPDPKKIKAIAIELEALNAIKLQPKGLLNGLGEEFKTLNDLMYAETIRTGEILGTELPMQIENGVLKAMTAASEFKKLTDDLNENLSNLISNSLSSSVNDLFSSIGEAIANGGNVVGAIGKSLLKSFGSFLSDMGKMLIQYGTLAIVKGALDNLIKVGGVSAIAAGAAAIAVGAALSVAGSAIGTKASGGMDGGSISSSAGVSTPNFSSSNVSSGGLSNGGEVRFVITGDEFIGFFNRSVAAEDRVSAG